LKQYHIAELARRLTGVHLTPRAEHLAYQAQRIREGYFEPMLDELTAASESELKELYVQRESQPQEDDPNWLPTDKSHL
jgi:hypothetical protein